MDADSGQSVWISPVVFIFPILLGRECGVMSEQDDSISPVGSRLLLLIGLHYLPRRVIKSLFAKYLKKLVATSLPDVFHDLSHEEANALILQYRDKRTQGLGCGIVHIVHCRS